MADANLAWVLFVRYVIQAELYSADGPETMFSEPNDITGAYDVALDATMRQITSMESALGPCPFRVQVESYITFYREERMAIFHGRQQSFTAYPDPVAWE